MKIKGWIMGEPGSKVPGIKVDIDITMSESETAFIDYAISGLYDTIIANGLLTRNEDGAPTINRLDDQCGFTRKIGGALFGQNEPAAEEIKAPEEETPEGGTN
jgi:hypothetical protein